MHIPGRHLANACGKFELIKRKHALAADLELIKRKHALAADLIQRQDHW